MARASAKGPVEAAAAKTRLDVLLATRDRLARALDQVDDRYAASLAKQISDVLREIESIKPQEVSAVDDLSARRAARRRPAKDPGGAAVSKQRSAGGSRPRGKRGTGT